MKIRSALWILSSACLTVVLGMSLSFAQSPEPAAQAVQTDPGQQATAAVARMAEYLAQAKSFGVTADIDFDAVQEDGEKIEFGETRKFIIERPEHLRIDEIKDSGEKSWLYFDGKNISLYHEKENMYAVDPRPGTVDAMIDYFTDTLEMRMPLAEMLSTQLPQVLKEKVREADSVGEATVDGVLCDHVALRGDEIDLQVWVAKGDRPLPQRVVITYKKDEGAPQFRAQFKDWDLAPVIAETEFSFVPPEKALKIVFSKQQLARANAPAVKEGK